MAKVKYCTYEKAKQWLKNKDLNVETFIDNMFNRTQKMFEYKNMPSEIPISAFEYMLQKNGNAFFTKHKGNFYIFNGGLGGELDAYYRPTIYTVSNPYLKLTENFKIDEDGILIKNDSRQIGLIPILAKYGAMVCDCEITLNLLSVVLRVAFLLSATDSRTRESANDFMRKIIDGDYSVISDSEFFNGVKLQDINNQGNLIPQMIQLTQYIKSNAFQEIGLNANFNMKKERLITAEVNVNEPSLIPLVENMLECRKEAIEKINEKYGLSIEVDLSCVWKTQAMEHEDLNTDKITKTNLEIEKESAIDFSNTENIDEHQNDTENAISDNADENSIKDDSGNKTDDDTTENKIEEVAK